MMNFENTMTEADFKRPLLEPGEEQLARQLLGEADFRVDALANTFFSRLVALFARKR